MIRQFRPVRGFEIAFWNNAIVDVHVHSRAFEVSNRSLYHGCILQAFECHTIACELLTSDKILGF